MVGYIFKDLATGFCRNIANVSILWLEFIDLGLSGSVSVGLFRAFFDGFFFQREIFFRVW